MSKGYYTDTHKKSRITSKWFEKLRHLTNKICLNHHKPGSIEYIQKSKVK